MECPYCKNIRNRHKILDPIKYLFTKKRIKMECICCHKYFMLYIDKNVNYNTRKTRRQDIPTRKQMKTIIINPSKPGGDIFEEVEAYVYSG